MATMIDTLEIVRDLNAAGMAEPQAAPMARIFKLRFEADRGETVSRDHLRGALAELRAELKADIAELRGEIGTQRADIARLERDIVFKLGGLMVVIAAILGALGVLF